MSGATMPVQLTSVADVADVEVVRGARADGPADLLVEVPHAADRADYDALAARMAGALPADLHEFFSVNTDVGAWELGRRAAELVVAADPARTAIAIRCRIPRTFIDTNRIEEATDDLAAGGMTASVPAYVTDERDRALLLGLHRRYVQLVERAHAELSPRAAVLLPHTYGPVTLGIDRVDERIVEELRRAHEPDRLATWPVRHEVDLITRSDDGEVTASAALVAAVGDAYRALGVQVGENATYHLHPATLAHRWAARFRDRILCLEVRRDLLVRRWTWNDANEVLPEAVDRFAAPIAAAIDAWLRAAAT